MFTSCNVCRVLGKLIILSIVAVALTSGACSAAWSVPLGVVLCAVSVAGFDIIQHECARARFFKSKNMNRRCAVLLFWAGILLAAGVLLFLMCHRSGFNLSDDSAILNTTMVLVIPLALHLWGNAVEPAPFACAREHVLAAELILRQLQGSDPGTTVPPVVDVEHLPFHQLASVMSELRRTAASFETAAKLRVQLPRGERKRLSLLAFLQSPLRSMAAMLLLSEFTFVFYALVAFYFVLVSVGSTRLSGACIIALALVPFLQQTSWVGDTLRALEEDIRLAQNVAVEKPCSGTTEVDDTLPVKWPMVIYLSLVHAAAFYSLFVFFACGGVCPFVGGVAMKWQTFVWAGLVYVASGLGITGGVHRLWSHRSYKAALPLRVLLMVFNSCANQGTIFQWARDHRVHHLFSDTSADPYDASRGFFFSHVGWLLVKKHPAVAAAGKNLNLSDLFADPVVMFQKRLDPAWNVLWCFVLPAFAASLWGDSRWNGFLLAGVLRYVLVLNASWTVNSVVHSYGGKPYNAAHATTENGWVSLVTLGEGWHNWHHAFDYDYATAELGSLSQFNPTKVFIDVMAFVGLVWGRKRATDVWTARKARWEKHSGRSVCESVEGPPLFKQRVITFGPSYHEEAECSTR